MHFIQNNNCYEDTKYKYEVITPNFPHQAKSSVNTRYTHHWHWRQRSRPLSQSSPLVKEFIPRHQTVTLSERESLSEGEREFCMKQQ